VQRPMDPSAPRGLGVRRTSGVGMPKRRRPGPGKDVSDLGLCRGAGDGNRTGAVSLGSTPVSVGGRSPLVTLSLTALVAPLGPWLGARRGHADSWDEQPGNQLARRPTRARRARAQADEVPTTAPVGLLVAAEDSYASVLDGGSTGEFAGGAGVGPAPCPLRRNDQQCSRDCVKLVTWLLVP
jgi:hypothetical protein